VPLYLAEKNELIQYLSMPVALESDDPLLQLIIKELNPIWGYDETRAQDMVDRIDGQFVWYREGRLDREGNAAFETEAAAFGRLVLTERSAKAFYPLAYETSNDIAGTVIDFVGIGLGTVSAIKSQPPLPDDNPFSEAALKLKAKLYSRILSSLDSTWEILLNTIEDDALRQQFQDLREGIFRTVQLRLDAGQTVEDMILDEVFQRYIALALTSKYLKSTQDALFQAADGVPIAALGRAEVTGSFIKAEGYNDHLNMVVAEETNRVHNIHERFENGSNVLAVASEISSLMKGTFVGEWTFAISTVMNTYLEGYKGYCGFSHYSYLKTSMDWAKQYAFDAEEILLDTLPDADHCRPFEWWPDWLSMNNNHDRLAKGSSTQNVLAGDVYLSEDLLTAIITLQQTVSDLVPSESLSLETFLPALDAYLEAEAKVNTQLEFLEDSITLDELENPQIYQLYQLSRSLSGESMAYSMGLLAYLYEPENAELREQMSQKSQDIVAIAEDFQGEIAAANDIPRQLLGGEPKIVEVILPAQIILGQEITSTIMLFNPSSEATAVQLTATGDASLRTDAEFEMLTLPPGYSEHMGLHIKGTETGLHLIEVQLVQNGKAIDISSAAVEILDEMVETASEEIPETRPLSEDVQPEEPETAAVDTKLSETRMLLGVSGLLLLVVGGGLVFMGVQRNQSGA
jgi:hypothetical protein